MAIDLSSWKKPYSAHLAAYEFPKRLGFVVQYVARRATMLEQFEGNADGATMVAMAKLHLCRLNQIAGGKGDIPRSPATDEVTTFDPPGKTMLTTRALVDEAVEKWKTDKHVGTDVSLEMTIAYFGGMYALLAASLALGFAAFTFIAGLLLGMGFEDVVLTFVANAALGVGLAGAVGAGFGILQAIGCHSNGDHDMAMMGLIPLLYRYGDLLSEDAYNNILGNLLAQHTTGGKSSVHTMTHICGRALPSLLGPQLGETENHILMTETARYLTNYKLLMPSPHHPTIMPPYNANFDNKANGLRDWWLEHLQKFLQNDFWEFNSRGYLRHAVLPLQNLYEFAPDDEVRKSARIVLDYLSAKFAVTSNGSRRSVPFRRRHENVGKSGLFDGASDEDTYRFLMLAGDTSVLNLNPAPGGLGPGPKGKVAEGELPTLVQAGLNKYRVPLLILDLILDRTGNRYLQRFRHGTWDHGYGDPAAEVTFSSGKYLITGGGLFADGRSFLGNEGEKASAVPTTLMPTAAGSDWRECIRIEGAVADEKRSNLGVAPGFACGLNPVIPDWMVPAEEFPKPDCYRTPRPEWTFINCNEYSQCVRQYGYFVAVYREKCSTELSKELSGNGTFGFFAVAELEEGSTYSFDTFVEEILQINEGTGYTSEGIHTFAFPSNLGPSIDFCAVPTKSGNYAPLLWPIVSINGNVYERDITRWPLADSEVFNAAGMQTSQMDWIIKSFEHKGCVMIDNPKLDQRLVLDLTSAYVPRLSLTIGDRHAKGCRCPLEARCDRRDIEEPLGPLPPLQTREELERLRPIVTKDPPKP